MAIQFKKAERKRARLRLGMMGASGSGKTMGAIKLALGIASHPSKILVMDSERGSASLYEDLPNDLGYNGDTYQVFEFGDSFDPKLYIDVIHQAEREGFEVIVIDSLSHAWDGVGGALDKVDQKSANSSNSFSAWRDVSAIHRRLVDAILQSPCHIICTLRSKTEYVLETNAKGKQVPRKIGVAPIQRQGMEYEFTVFLDIDDEHFAFASKDRTRLLDGQRMLLDVKLGEKLLDWLNKGVEVAEEQKQPEPPKSQKKPAGNAETCNGLVALYDRADNIEDIESAKKSSERYLWGESGTGVLAGAEARARARLHAKLMATPTEEPPQEQALPKLPAETTPQVQATTAPTTTQTCPEMTLNASTNDPQAPPPVAHEVPAETVKLEGTRKKAKELIAAYEMASTENEVHTVTEAALGFTWSELGLEALVSAENKAKDRIAKKAPPPNEAASNDRAIFTDALMAVTRAVTVSECEYVRDKYANAQWGSEDRELFASAVKSRIYELSPKITNRPVKRDALVDRIRGASSTASLRILEPNYSEWSREDREIIKQEYDTRTTQLRNSERETARPKPTNIDPYKRDWWEQNSNRTGD